MSTGKALGGEPASRDSRAVDATEEARQVRRTLALLSSVVLSREPWTSQVEAHYQDGLDALDRLEKWARDRDHAAISWEAAYDQRKPA